MRFRADNGLVWSSKTLHDPGDHDSALAAVDHRRSRLAVLACPRRQRRARSRRGVHAQPFSMRWSSVPSEWRPESGSPADMPGYVRWHPVDGATSYQVWFVNAGKVISTITNVADEREYYTFHDKPGWTGDVTWRVRAVRRVYGKTSNKLPAVSYGPWSPEYTWTNTTDPLASGTDVQPVAAVSDRVSTPDRPDVHSLMPAFLFAGNGDTNEGLHRVYVFSDSDCVNAVFRGAIVGGPAYAPRTSGPLALPQAPRTSRRRAGRSSRTARKATRSPSTRLRSRRRRRLADDSGSTPSALRRRQACLAGCECRVRGSEGRPLGSRLEAGRPLLLRRRAGPGRHPRRQGRIPRDRAAAGRVPGTLAADGTQTASQARPRVRQEQRRRHADRAGDRAVARRATRSWVRRAGTSFYGAPLVTWDAAPAAAAYDVEWSRKPYRWHAAGHIRTPATSALLPVTGGTWWYRVRGINPSLPGNTKMTWSRKVRIQIAKPTYSVVGR